MNKCLFTGNIGNSLELKSTNSNVPFVQFSLALQRPFKNQEGNYDVDWVTIIAYRLLAENLCKYQDKGSKIAVDCHVRVRNYDKENKTYYITEFIADSIEFLDPVKSRYPETDEQIDETFKHGNPVNPPEKLVNEPNDILPF